MRKIISVLRDAELGKIHDITLRRMLTLIMFNLVGKGIGLKDSLEVFSELSWEHVFTILVSQFVYEFCICYDFF